MKREDVCMNCGVVGSPVQHESWCCMTEPLEARESKRRSYVLEEVVG